MSLCSRCQSFSLRDLVRAPDSTYSQHIQDVEKGARSGCTFCNFLTQQVQPLALTFEVHPDQCWLRLQARSPPDGQIKDTHGLQLDGITVCLADSYMVTKAERASREVWLGLAASRGM